MFFVMAAGAFTMAPPQATPPIPGTGIPYGAAPRPAGAACRPSTVRIGRPVDDAIRDYARTHPDRLRIVRRGGMAMMDFVEDRLTLIVDDNGLVADIRCG